MAVICPHGSVPNPGVESRMLVDPSLMADLLPPQLQWLKPFLPFIGSFTLLDVPAFCSEDPPEIAPVPNALQFASLPLRNPFELANQAGEWCAAVLTSYLWYRLCHCLVDDTPPPPSGPAPPADLPAINPPSAVRPLPAAPCITVDNAYASIITSGVAVVVADLDWSGLTASGLRLTADSRSDSAAGANFTYTIQHGHNAGGFVVDRTDQVTFTAPYNVTRLFATVPGSPLIHIIGQRAGAAGSLIIRSTWDLFCNGQVPGAPQSPCLADPQTLGLLNQILGMVTLIQRQAVPFAYVPGAVHAGLVGHGSFAVQGLLGVLVELTTIPDYLGSVDGTPIIVFDAGWVDVGTADGYQANVRIESASKLWFPPDMGAMTVVSYTLEPNVTARITELRREP